MRCLAEETVVGFIRRDLSEAAMADVDRHMAACSDCRELVADAAKSLIQGEASSTLSAPSDSKERAVASPGRALDPGQRVARYVVSERIGAGGMGVLYAAHDPTLSRKVALKLLREDTLGGANRQALLLREAQAMAQLAHPNVVGIYDAGTFEGQVFIAMEFVDGRTLRQWLREATRSWQEILGVFVDAGRGLAAAHEVGIVHRDFKPDNVMIGENGRVKVSDFGLARSFDGEASTSESGVEFHAWDKALTLTRTGAIKGTPAYMAPEQLLGERVEPRTDQFSFCVALYEALFGLRPFDALTEAPRPPPRSSRVPAAIGPILLRGLRADPAERYPSMDAVLAELARAADDGPRLGGRARAGIAVGASILLVGVVTAFAAHSRRAPAEATTREPAVVAVAVPEAMPPVAPVAPVAPSDPAPPSASPAVATATPTATATPLAKTRGRDKIRPTTPAASRAASPQSGSRAYDDSPLAPPFAQGAR